MALIRLTLVLDAPLVTPLTGPTLFGQLCWLRREADGQDALSRWLADERAIWRLSDAFPAGYLPRPLVRPRPLSREKLARAKAIKRRALVRRETWLAHRAAWDESVLDPERDLAADSGLAVRVAHNVIDRRRGGTLDEGGLYFVEEDWRHSDPARKRLDISVETDDDPDRVRDAFALLGDLGYGRKASTGRGRWTVERAASDPELTRFEGQRRMSLSRGFYTPATMADALWKVRPHFGRAGPQVTAAGTAPFKRPVLLLEPGATFRPVGEGPFGAWRMGVHPDRPEIGVNGLHVTLPFTEAEP